jgi:hypothetical protein
MATEGVLATLQQGWHALAGVDAPKAVIGGLALTAWKHARSTRDADVLVAIDRQRMGEVVAAIVSAGFRPRHAPPLRVIDGQGISSAGLGKACARSGSENSRRSRSRYGEFDPAAARGR